MAAEERKTISDILEEVKEQMCIYYCKFQESTAADESLMNAICDKCPLMNL